MKLEKKEKEIEKEILTYLSRRSDVVCWKNETQGTFDPTKRVFRKPSNNFRRKGVSDILGMVRLGVKKSAFIAIEVKSKTGRVSKEQSEFIETILSGDGVAFVTRSVEETMAKLDEFLYPNEPNAVALQMFG